MKTVEIYITDKTNKKFFVEIIGEQFAESGVRNLKRHLEVAKKHPKMYSFMDIDSAVIIKDIK